MNIFFVTLLQEENSTSNFLSNAYTFGFNGKEKDDELKGSGNSYDFGDRMQDPRLGRWLAPDKKAGKYAGHSSYNYALNNPIILIDPDGNDVFIAFTGGPTGGGERILMKDAGTTGKIAIGAWANAMRNKVEYDAAVFAPGWTAGNAVDNAYEFIKTKYTPGEKVILYGYSYGGDFAIELAKKLEGEGITVSLLVTVDASDGLLQNSTVETEIPDNVKVNLNYYQTNESGASSSSKSTDETSSGSSSSQSESGSANAPGSSGGPNTAKDPSKTKVINANLTGASTTHGNIDETVKNAVQKVINKASTPPGSSTGKGEKPKALPSTPKKTAPMF